MNPKYALARSTVLLSFFLLGVPAASNAFTITQESYVSHHVHHSDSTRVKLQYFAGIGILNGDAKLGGDVYYLERGYSLSLRILLANLMSKESSTGGWGLLFGMDINPIARQVEKYEPSNGWVPVDSSWQVRQNLYYLAICLVDRGHSLLHQLFPRASFSHQLIVGVGINLSDWKSGLLRTIPSPASEIEIQPEKLGTSYFGAVKYGQLWLGITYHHTKSKAIWFGSKELKGYLTYNTWWFHIGYGR